MILVARTQKQKSKGKRKPSEGMKKKKKEKKKRNYNTYHDPLSKEWIEILNSPMNKFLIPAFKIYS